MMLHEKYRPREWSDLVGQDKAVATHHRTARVRPRCVLHRLRRIEQLRHE